MSVYEVTFTNGQWFDVRADSPEDAARIASREMPHAGDVQMVHYVPYSERGF